MKFVSITSDEVKEAILEGNRISIQMHTYNEVRYAVDNPSAVEECFKFDNSCEKMFFGYITICKEDKYVFLLMQNIYSADTEKCLDNLIDLMTALGVESKQKSLKIKDLESEIESVSAEIDFIDEVDKFNDELNEDDISIVSTVNNQVKLPSQRSYITIDNFDMFT
jgi:hypothetical protein